MYPIHDPFVRSILSGKQEAIDFLDSSFPKQITENLDLENLELMKESFVTMNEESRTDLLYKIPLKSSSSVFVYVLFEHKSYYDPHIYFQLLEYLSKIYSWQKQSGEVVKVVIPFVFYHGEKGWDLGLNFIVNFDLDTIPENLLKFIPNFAIQLLELKQGGKVFQTKNVALRNFMRMVQIIREDPEAFLSHLKEIYHSILDEKEDAKRIYILKNLLEYLFRARKDAETYTKKEIIKEIEGEYMNLLEKIREEGKIEGELKKALETARKMREYGDSLEKIIIITGLTESQLGENGIM
jgi:predicted transposase/invertase (TIGR01784 family)